MKKAALSAAAKAARRAPSSSSSLTSTLNSTLTPSSSSSSSTASSTASLLASSSTSSSSSSSSASSSSASSSSASSSSASSALASSSSCPSSVPSSSSALPSSSSVPSSSLSSSSSSSSFPSSSFPSSSSSSSSSSTSASAFAFHDVDGVPGLLLARSALARAEQARLWKHLLDEGWIRPAQEENDANPANSAENPANSEEFPANSEEFPANSAANNAEKDTDNDGAPKRANALRQSDVELANSARDHEDVADPVNSDEERDANLFQSAEDLFGSAEDVEDLFKSAHGAEDAADPLREADAGPWNSVQAEDVFGGVVPGPHNQGMYFGTLPAALQPTVALLEAPVRAAWARCAGADADGPARTPLFDQAILNVYGPEGKIRAHVDLMRFEDGIAVVSLGSAATMTFAPAVVSTPPDAQPAAVFASPPDAWPAAVVSSPPDARPAAVVASPPDARPADDVNVVLCPGDVLLLTDASRYQWTHRIDAADADRWPDGSVRPRGTRVSLTFRRLTAAATLMTDDGV